MDGQRDVEEAEEPEESGGEEEMDAEYAEGKEGGVEEVGLEQHPLERMDETLAHAIISEQLAGIEELNRQFDELTAQFAAELVDELHYESCKSSGHVATCGQLAQETIFSSSLQA